MTAANFFFLATFTLTQNVCSQQPKSKYIERMKAI